MSNFVLIELRILFGGFFRVFQIKDDLSDRPHDQCDLATNANLLKIVMCSFCIQLWWLGGRAVV